MNNKKEIYLKGILDSFKIKTEEIKLKETEYFDFYEIKFPLGVKVSKLENLFPEINLHLKASKMTRGFFDFDNGCYRLEIQKRDLPTSNFSTNHLKSETHNNPIILGTDIYNENIIFDLNKMPNLLIGGIPGSGKSIVLHNIILSLLHNDNDIYLVDPKYVEFNIYKNISQIKSISNNLDDTIQMLSNVQDIMNERFQLISLINARNIIEYNNKVKTKLKFITIVIDEWADLYFQDKKIESYLCAIAQKGRAAGISVIIATQRPSSKVVNGLIKANFPAKISMKVSTSIDSRIILEQSGAEMIKEVGGGFFLHSNSNEMIYFKSFYSPDIEKELMKYKNIKSWFKFW